MEITIVETEMRKIFFQGESRSVHLSAIGDRIGTRIKWITPHPGGITVAVENLTILMEEEDTTLWLGEIPWAKDTKVRWKKEA